MIIFIFAFLLVRSFAYEFSDLDVAVQTAAKSVSSVFSDFFEDLKTFFVCKYEAVVHRRNLAKTAFNKFISESVNKNSSLKCAGKNKNEARTSETRWQTVKNSTRATQLRQNIMKEVPIYKLITLHGYRLETHTTVTTDGYILTLHRILYKGLAGSEVKKILLHHGLLGSSEDWLLLGSNKALPYLLWIAGYDVWLTNARGNKLSKMHTRFPVNSDEFWDFSFHEIGIYDISAAIDYIKEKSDSNTKLYYIGYSMGATGLLVLLSTYPRYNKLLQLAILLAPLAFMYNVTGPLRFLADQNGKYNSIDYFGVKEFRLNRNVSIKYLRKFCTGDLRLCVNPINVLANGGKDIINRAVKNNVISYAVGGGSAKTIKHYAQLATSGQFQMYDYGPVENLKKYGMKAPPTYRLNDVTLRVAIISSTSDLLATVPDIMSLLPFLSNPIVHHVIKRYEFGHTDFLWADDAPDLVYNFILDILWEANVSKFQKESDLANQFDNS